MAAFPGFVTTYEAADELNVSHSQVTRYIRNGLLEGIKQGNQWFVPKSSLKSFEKVPRGNPNFRKNGKSTSKA